MLIAVNLSWIAVVIILMTTVYTAVTAAAVELLLYRSLLAMMVVHASYIHAWMNECTHNTHSHIPPTSHQPLHWIIHLSQLTTLLHILANIIAGDFNYTDTSRSSNGVDNERSNIIALHSNSLYIHPIHPTHTCKPNCSNSSLDIIFYSTHLVAITIMINNSSTFFEVATNYYHNTSMKKKEIHFYKLQNISMERIPPRNKIKVCLFRVQHNHIYQQKYCSIHTVRNN